MSAHVFRTFRFALRLNAVEARVMTRELERQRLLYNAAHQERQDAPGAFARDVGAGLKGPASAW